MITQHQIDQVKQLYDQGLGEKRISQNLQLKVSQIHHAYKKLNLWGQGRRSKDKIKSRYLDQKQCRVCLITKSIGNFKLNIRAAGNWYSAKCIICQKQYNKTLNASQRQRENRKLYRKNNKNKLSNYEKNRRKNNPNFRLKKIISANIYHYLNLVGKHKNKSHKQYLPYSIQQLKQHLESLFEPWMNWNNQGKYNPKTWDNNNSNTWTWQIDHIIPHSTFLYTSVEDQAFKDCWALSNLRPLNSKQNAIDGGNKSRHNSI